MKNIDKLRAAYEDYWPMCWAFGLVLAVNAADIFTSMIGDGLESNSYMRHADGSFWLYRCLVIKAMFLFASWIVGYAAYRFSPFETRWVQFPACAFWLYRFYEMVPTVIHNLLVWAHWGVFFAGD